MRFIPQGPDVPERLIRAHEDGQVVFFCGAGISYPAGLKNFTWLVDEVYRRLHRTRSGPEELAYSEHRYDAVLTLLERDIAGGREAVRAHLPEILKPDLRKKNALATHRALLTLARDRNDRTRLVTTNFDRLFVRADKRSGHISAPHLPTPKQSRWDGVVYLHGLIDDTPTETNLNRLVLTSGDFGLAYLTERWASRFVSELFARYTVCFIGYSADDVVLRYMLDALSADELLGEKPIEVFSFAGAEPGGEGKTLESWRAKGVTPIIYDSGDDHSHSNLHHTLRSWAKTYQDGLQGRRGVALREARLSPDKLDASGSTARLIWALNEPSGEIAKAFATVEPPPVIDWLAAFTDYRFGHSDLPHFGIECAQYPERHAGHQGELKYSLLHHPSAPAYAQWTNLVVRDGGLSALGGLDPVPVWLAQWLCRHLDKSETILWVAKNGGRLHPRFEELVRSALRGAQFSDAYRRITSLTASQPTSANFELLHWSNSPSRPLRATTSIPPSPPLLGVTVAWNPCLFHKRQQKTSNASPSMRSTSSIVRNRFGMASPASPASTRSLKLASLPVPFSIAVNPPSSRVAPAKPALRFRSWSNLTSKV